jgi:putative spermidine/putrescine transport system substrate-binding protein
MDSNISRRKFLSQLGVGSTLLLAEALVGCKSHRHLFGARSRSVRFYGTATLDVGAEGWGSLEHEVGAQLLLKDNGNDAGPVIAQMIAGTASIDYDLGGLLGGAESVLATAGTILPWDLSKIPNWSTEWQWAKAIEHVRVNGHQYGLPLVVNADSMIYLPDKIKSVAGYESGIVDTYAAIFDPRLKGRTSMEDAWVNSAIFTAIYLKQNNMVTITDPGNLTEAELKEVMGFLIDKKRSGQFRKLWSGWEQGVELLRSGEVWAMTGWEPIVKALTSQGVNAKYAIPKEGYEGWSIDLLLHAGAEKRGLVELCHDVANWLYEGSYGTSLALSRGYAVPNDSTANYIRQHNPQGAQQALDTVNRVQGKASNTLFWQNVRPDNYRLYEEWWSKLRAAS